MKNRDGKPTKFQIDKLADLGFDFSRKNEIRTYRDAENAIKRLSRQADKCYGKCKCNASVSDKKDKVCKCRSKQNEGRANIHGKNKKPAHPIEGNGIFKVCIPLEARIVASEKLSRAERLRIENEFDKLLSELVSLANDLVEELNSREY